MAVQGNALPWKPDARAMQRKVLPAEVSEANARQYDGVQFKAKQSNVSKCNAKHEPKHIHMRRKPMQCTTVRHTTKSRSTLSIPVATRNLRRPRKGRMGARKDLDQLTWNVDPPSGTRAIRRASGDRSGRFGGPSTLSPGVGEVQNLEADPPVATRTLQGPRKGRITPKKHSTI